jgi:hypothetical protein
MPPIDITCPTCGSTALVDAVAGQCPHCLIRMALSEEDPLPSIGLALGVPQRQFGEYLLGRQIGVGGMGVVYEARRLSDDSAVAIKLIRDFHVASPTLLRRFTIEAEAAARLEHSHIVRIHEIGECEGHPFFSMDLIEGENLNARITRGAVMSPGEIARLMATISRAVQHAHARGVLHRDLKPGNILIDLAGEPHLTDFGLAKMLQHDSDENNVATLTTAGAPGTPSYMSPEQVSGGEASSASDIYGLGAVLYALMTGRPPFQGATSLELFKQIVEQQPVRPRMVNRSLPPALETICLKCLEKDPRRRYATAEALAEDLESFTAGGTIMARPPTAIHRSRQWIRRNPVGAALIASLCLGLFVALALLKVVNDQRRQMELDRDQTFDEGMQKVSQIWRDPGTKAVTVSARELAILAGRSPTDSRDAKFQLTFGVSADDGPSSMAQRYARLLGDLQAQMQRELGEKTVFHLHLLKRFHGSEDTLLRGEVDLLVLSPVDFLRAEQVGAGIVALALGNSAREGVIFARTNCGTRHLAGLRGKSLALPDPGLSLSVWAKALLVDAGLRGSDFTALTNIMDRGAEVGTSTASATETIDRVLRGEWDAGVTHRGQFERYRHLGLLALEHFPETPDVVAARAGLETQITAALQNVLRSPKARQWPDSRFAVESIGPEKTAGASLKALRGAIARAAQF